MGWLSTKDEDMNRRTFIEGFAAVGGLVAAGGCRTLGLCRGDGRSCRDYFCTWETQRALWKGPTCERDNLNEEVLLGRNGWARTLFPDARHGLYLTIDDGWDVPYGAKNQGDGFAVFGRIALNEERFPSFTGSDVQRLRAFNAAVRDCGWKGAGLWIAAQAEGETFEKRLSRAQLCENLKRRLGESADAGIGYWKVDWGIHSPYMWYREMMSELAREYAPDTIIDHSLGFDNALNGVAHPYDKPRLADGSLDLVGEKGRMIGNPDFERVRQRYTDIMSFSDSFRTYDTLGPMTSATATERAVFELLCADATSSRCTINVEDEPLLGAALGLGIGVMRAAVWPDPVVPEPQPKQRRLAEIARCVAWRPYAPVFGSDRGCPVQYSEATAEENWHYADKSTWWSAAFGRTLFQRAPSVVSRGLPLPDVKSRDGEAPIVCASRHPDTGAVAVASLPLLTQAKGRHTPVCDVTLDAMLDARTPLGVFGSFGSLTLKCADAGRVLARDLLSEKAVDITDVCTFENGRVMLPGGLLDSIGVSAKDDTSSPGTVICWGSGVSPL